jgi:hypothetical protein
MHIHLVRTAQHLICRQVEAHGPTARRQPPPACQRPRPGALELQRCWARRSCEGSQALGWSPTLGDGDGVIGLGHNVLPEVAPAHDGPHQAIWQLQQVGWNAGQMTRKQWAAAFGLSVFCVAHWLPRQAAKTTEAEAAGRAPTSTNASTQPAATSSRSSRRRTQGIRTASPTLHGGSRRSSPRPVSCKLTLPAQAHARPASNRPAADRLTRVLGAVAQGGDCWEAVLKPRMRRTCTSQPCSPLAHPLPGS